MTNYRTCTISYFMSGLDSLSSGRPDIPQEQKAARFWRSLEDEDTRAGVAAETQEILRAVSNKSNARQFGQLSALVLWLALAEFKVEQSDVYGR